MDSSWQLEQPDKMSRHSQSQSDFTEKLAAQGHALSTQLLKFASVAPGVDPCTPNLASAIGSTAHVLTSIHSSPIPPHPTIRALCLGIKSMFDRVETALQDVDKWEADGEFIQKKEVEEGDGRRTKFVEWGNEVSEELGGWAEADAFNLRLERLRSNLVCVSDSVMWLGFKKKEREGTLDDEDKEMLKKVGERIPNVLGILEVREKDLLGTVEDILKGIEMGKIKAAKPGPRLGPRGRAVDDDVISIRSFDSAATVQFEEAEEQYEYWLIQKIEGEKKTVRSWGFLGMRMTEDMEDTAYFVEGKPRPQKQMKARDEEAKTDEEKAKREARIQKTLAAMPRRLSTEIQYIIQDRERTSSNTKFIREWSLVDLKPLKPRIHTPAISWGAWWKGQGGTAQWECIIKGVTIETAEEKMKIPNRYDDPFRKYQRRPIIERYPEPREIYPRPVAVVEPRSRAACVQVEGRRRGQGFVIPELSEEEREEKIAGFLAAVTVAEGTEAK